MEDKALVYLEDVTLCMEENIVLRGGWRLIGRTPLRLFNPDDEETPTLLEAGDWLRFRPISANEFERIASEVAAHRYVPERFHEEGGE